MWSNICSLKQGFWKSEMRNEIYIFFIKKKSSFNPTLTSVLS